MTSSSPVYKKLLAARDFIRTKTDFVPRAAVVLGSGLGGFADTIETVAQVNYADIPDFPRSTVMGHRGRFVFGYERGLPVVLLQGRVHYYEGYSAPEAVMPVRIAGMLGAETVVLTNAAGAVNTSFSAGDLMLIEDHILHGVPSPLIGDNIDELGTRFPDMSEIYAMELRALAETAASSQGISLQSGVYLQTSGPNFESPAEIRAYRVMGADVVGMSTAVEAVAARHMGMRVCGISCVSNLAAGLSAVPLTHEEVQIAADECAPRFRALISELIAGIS